MCLATAAFAGCIDTVTQPGREGSLSVSARANSAPAMPGNLIQSDTVTVHREITATMRTGRVAHEEITLRQVHGLLAVPHGTNPPVGPVLDTSHMTLTLQQMPLPPLSVVRFNRKAAAALNPSTWTKTRRYDGIPGATIEESGAGDAPPTIVRLVKDGEVLLESHEEWVAGPGTWDLVRVENMFRDFREVITIAHSGTNRPGFSPPSSGTSGNAILRAGVPSSFDMLSPMYDQDDCVADKCAAAREAANDASQDLLLAGAAMAAGCFADGPIVILTCPAAVYAWHVAQVRAQRANDKLAQCESAAREECSKCYGVESIGRSVGLLAPRGGRGSGGAPAIGKQTVCDDVNNWTFDPGSDGGDPTFDVTCWYDITYNVDTGEIIDAVFLYCDVYET